MTDCSRTIVLIGESPWKIVIERGFRNRAIVRNEYVITAQSYAFRNLAVHLNRADFTNRDPARKKGDSIQWTNGYYKEDTPERVVYEFKNKSPEGMARRDRFLSGRADDRPRIV